MSDDARKETPSAEERNELLAILRTRFEEHPERHRGVDWATVLARLEAAPEKVAPLLAMERTGGEPDVVGRDEATGEVVFVDCAPESPTGRRSVCYDREGLESRKTARPETDAVSMATEMGIEILSEEEYLALQELGELDTRTSSWLATPAEVRERGGAIFGDRRYGRVFVYHNGAQSYYAARGFRGSLRV